MKIEEIKQFFFFWCDKLDIKDKVEMRRDNRISVPMLVMTIKNGNKVSHILYYHSKRIAPIEKFVGLWILFHEMGHIVNKLPYNSRKEKIISERKAEEYAFRILKKYFKEEYKKVLNRIKKRKLLNRYKKEEPLYYEAFKAIKEYKYE